nr:hypothetical protein [Tanacetum cinerariifolium]
MDDPSITMEEYIRLKEEKTQSHGRTFDWQTATYGKMEYYEVEDDNFTNFETEYPAIVFDDISNAALSCKPTVSPLNNNEIDFIISFDESDDEDNMVIFDENSFSYKIIYVDNLKTDSENGNDKVNMPSSPSPEPMIGYTDDMEPSSSRDQRHPWLSISGRGQAPEKVIGVDLFYLCSIDRRATNVPYLLAQYMFRHAEGRKSGARLSRGHFIGRLVA